MPGAKIEAAGGLVTGSGITILHDKSRYEGTWEHAPAKTTLTMKGWPESLSFWPRSDYILRMVPVATSVFKRNLNDEFDNADPV